MAAAVGSVAVSPGTTDLSEWLRSFPPIETRMRFAAATLRATSAASIFLRKSPVSAPSTARLSTATVRPSFRSAAATRSGYPPPPAASPAPRVSESPSATMRKAPLPVAAAAATGSGAFRIVALGDSLTRGAGDAAGGGGYPERVAAALRKEGRTVAVDNLAVDGAETGDFLRKMEEAGVAQRVAAADLILVSIGGNDLSHSLRSVVPGETTADPTAAALTGYTINFQRI